MRTPKISWDQDFDSGDLYCKLRVPRSWLMEVNHFKRQLQLWWWLTTLVWRLPR